MQFKQGRQREDERGKLNSNAVREPGEFPAFLLTFTLWTDTKVKYNITVIFLNTFGMTKSWNTYKQGYKQQQKPKPDIIIQHMGIIE